MPEPNKEKVKPTPVSTDVAMQGHSPPKQPCTSTPRYCARWGGVLNVARRAAMDAVEEARGAPAKAQDSLQSPLHVLKAQISTNWGDPAPAQTERSALQVRPSRQVAPPRKQRPRAHYPPRPQSRCGCLRRRRAPRCRRRIVSPPCTTRIVSGRRIPW